MSFRLSLCISWWSGERELYGFPKGQQLHLNLNHIIFFLPILRTFVDSVKGNFTG